MHYAAVDFVSRAIPRPIHIVQYDNSLPVIVVSLYKDGQVYTIPEGSIVNFRWGKPDGNIVYNHALGWNEDMTMVYVEVDQQMAAAYGKAEMVIEILRDERNEVKFAQSSALTVSIDRNPVQNANIKSTSEAEAIYEFVLECRRLASEAKVSASNANLSEQNAAQYSDMAATSETNAKTSETNAEKYAVSASYSSSSAKSDADRAKEYADNSLEIQQTVEDLSEESEAWAVGMRDGKPVESSDETYQNNSKYYAGLAVGLYDDVQQTLQEAKNTLDTMNDRYGRAKFEVDMDTGEIMYDDCDTYEFSINETTGNLEWR